MALALFVVLALSVSIGWRLPVPHDLFLRADPFLWLSVSLAARELAPHAGFALALVLITAGLGRVFCGWICPLGTVQDAARAALRRGLTLPVSRSWTLLRYGILAAALGAGWWGVNLAGWVDPLVVVARALHLPSAAAWASAAIAWGALAAVAGLTLLAPRIWCRVLCPLGALLSLLARWAPWTRRVADACVGCGACAQACPLGNSPDEMSSTECLVCGRCAAVCPQGAISLPARPDLGPREKPVVPRFDASRRAALVGIGGILTGTLFGQAAPANRNRPLRPPATPVEDEFAARCVGCGACMAVCPTNGLRPMLRPGRLDAVFSPELAPRIGPCLPDCLACGAHCPTGAIRFSSIEEKWSHPIGLAGIDPARCLPWAQGERCVICLDACPPEFDAIELKRGEIGGPFRPFVLASRCTGCGLCEHRCPVEGTSAIRVFADSRPGFRLQEH